jgi:hypothetical protein|tara:strand:- start:85 stop:465 length:381 start_codon:yes stop_codon:yes gene_type:complete
MNINKVEIKELEEKGLIKIPLIVAILTEAKEQGLKWIFQCEGENFFPEEDANLNRGDYDNWIYTNDIEKSLKHKNDTDEVFIVFDKGGWIRWTNYEGDGVDALCDWLTVNHIDRWLSPLAEKYYND